MRSCGGGLGCLEWRALDYCKFHIVLLVIMYNVIILRARTQWIEASGVQ